MTHNSRIVTRVRTCAYQLVSRQNLCNMSMDLDEAITRTSIEISIVLKNKQLEALKLFCSGQDVFVTLPTGYGKTLIFAMLPLVFDKLKSGLQLRAIDIIAILYVLGVTGSIAVCISPLSVIMIELAARLNSLGIPAQFVREAQHDPDAQRKVLKEHTQVV